MSNCNKISWTNSYISDLNVLSSLNDYKVFTKLWISIVKNYFKQIIKCFGSKIFCISLLSVAELLFVAMIPYLIRIIVDACYQGIDSKRLNLLLFFFIYFCVGSSFLIMVNDYIKSYIGVKFKIKLANQFAKKISDYTFPFLVKRNTGELVFRNSIDVQEAGSLLIDLLFEFPLWVAKISIICLILFQKSIYIPFIFLNPIFPLLIQKLTK